MSERVLFIGGSRHGLGEMEPARSYTFVNGVLAHPDKDGSAERTLNATIEHYVRDDPGRLKIDGHAVYFLDELDQAQREERLACLVRSMAL